jgi:GT2 family glycosyltransferase
MISVIIVGIDRWEEYTRPLIAQIWGHHPDIEVCVIDNASNKPYPQADHIVRSDKRLSYAGAINLGMSKTTKPWVVVLNNDVRCDGVFVDAVTSLDHNMIYGMSVYSEPTFNWFSSWIFILNRATYLKVGEFDPCFEVCAYEDVDFCYRAMKLGIQTKKINLSFYHYDGKTRWSIEGYESTRSENRVRFEQKHGITLQTRTYSE